jgi:hypothetical protein
MNKALPNLASTQFRKTKEGRKEVSSIHFSWQVLFREGFIEIDIVVPGMTIRLAFNEDAVSTDGIALPLHLFYACMLVSPLFSNLRGINSLACRRGIFLSFRNKE